MKKYQVWSARTLVSLILLAGAFSSAWGQNRLTPALNKSQQAPGSAAQTMAAASGGMVSTKPADEGTEAAGQTEGQTAAAVAPAADHSKLSPELQAGLEQALEKFKKSDLAGALEKLNELYKANPQAVRPPRLYLTSWFAQLNNTKAVRASLELATEETPSDPEAFLLLGEIAFAQGELTAAELLFAQGETVLSASKIEPELIKALQIKLCRDKAKLAQARKRWDAMQGALGTLIKLEGETAETSRLVAISFFEKKEDESALKWFLHADELDKGKGLPAEAAMAQLYLRGGNAEKANASLVEAMKKYPTNSDVLSLAVVVALNENKLDEAGKYADQLLKNDPESVAVMKTCANVALFRNDFARAEQLFQAALVKAPNDTQITNGLALALAEEKSPEKTKLALQYAAGNVQKQNNNRNFLATLGWALYQAGDKAKAREILQRSAADGQVNPVAAYYLAVLLADEGKKDDAKKLLTAIVSVKAPFYKRPAATQLLEQLGK
ncbi:MAG: tetratricopeptide repeat protein [Thermoguttaceae bacterium]|nr:tetratricopeptide repeat protein [Thermoguttaceae bacterium]